MAESANKIEAKNTYVKIQYRLRIPNGRILKGAVDPEVLDFITGYAQVIPGLESRLIGHSQGEKMTFTVPSQEAFRERFDQLVFEKDKKDFHFPPSYTPYVGMELPIILSRDEGPDSVIITEIKENTIIVDANHPLAGAALQYDLEIVEARPAKQTEICAEWEGVSGEGCSTEGCSGGTCGIQEVTLGQTKE